MDAEISLIKESIAELCKNNRVLFKDNLSEQAICATLSQCIIKEIEKNYENFLGYYVDVEYNKGFTGRRKVIKSKPFQESHLKNVVCDLVVHNRGMKTKIPENLIAIEMKKTSDCRKKVVQIDEREFYKNRREADIMRLIALTSSPNNYDGYSMYNLPKANEDVVTVEGFQLGVFIEMNDIKSKKKAVPKDWDSNSITSLKIKFFVNGEELTKENTTICFCDDSFLVRKSS